MTPVLGVLHQLWIDMPLPRDTIRVADATRSPEIELIDVRDSDGGPVPSCIGRFHIPRRSQVKCLGTLVQESGGSRVRLDIGCR